MKMGGGETREETTTPVKVTQSEEKGAGLGFAEHRNATLEEEVQSLKYTPDPLLTLCQ